MDTGLEFSFGGLAAGCLEGPEFPRSPGRYRYVPYRSVGHLKMVQAVQKGSAAPCAFKDGARQGAFVVTSLPEQGVLQVESISTRRRWAWW